MIIPAPERLTKDLSSAMVRLENKMRDERILVRPTREWQKVMQNEPEEVMLDSKLHAVIYATEEVTPVDYVSEEDQGVTPWYTNMERFK